MRSRLKGIGLVIKSNIGSFASVSSFGSRGNKNFQNSNSVVKITNVNQDAERSLESSLYRSPFHIHYEEGEFIGEVL